MTKLTLTHNDAEVLPSDLTGKLVVKAYQHISRLIDQNTGSVNVSEQAARLFDTYDTLCGTLMAQQKYEGEFGPTTDESKPVKSDQSDKPDHDKEPESPKDPAPTTHPAANHGKEKGK